MILRAISRFCVFRRLQSNWLKNLLVFQRRQTLKHLRSSRPVDQRIIFTDFPIAKHQNAFRKLAISCSCVTSTIVKPLSFNF